jgi:hypothetical protein
MWPDACYRRHDLLNACEAFSIRLTQRESAAIRSHQAKVIAPFFEHWTGIGQGAATKL